MTIIEVNHTKDIPSKPMRAYALVGKETIDDCARMYERYYGVKPTQGYKWMNYVYFELPETGG
jgi:hypothetical protein